MDKSSFVVFFHRGWFVVCNGWRGRNAGRAQHDDAPAVVAVILFRSGAQTNALRPSDVLAPTPTTAPVLQLAVNCCCGGGFLVQAEVLASDCMRLPYRSGVFDAAISIAVLHHFSSEVRVCVCVFPVTYISASTKCKDVNRRGRTASSHLVCPRCMRWRFATCGAWRGSRRLSRVCGAVDCAEVGR